MSAPRQGALVFRVLPVVIPRDEIQPPTPRDFWPKKGASLSRPKWKEATGVVGWPKRWTPGSVNVRRKIAFSCLLQAEERNFLPHSRNPECRL